MCLFMWMGFCLMVLKPASILISAQLLGKTNHHAIYFSLNIAFVLLVLGSYVKEKFSAKNKAKVSDKEKRIQELQVELNSAQQKIFQLEDELTFYKQLELNN